MPGHWVWFTLPLIHFPGMHRILVGPEYIGALTPWSRRGRVAWAAGAAVLGLPRTALAVAAHPDDLEYFCGGTLTLLARRGVRVVGVLATRGERGGRLPDLPARRVQEQQRAAARLGYEARILDFPDRGVRAEDPALRDTLGRILAEVQPDLVLTFDPDQPFPLYHHPDHFAVARVLLSLWCGPALLFHTRAPNAVVDITPAFRDKLAAFLAHRSQLPRRGTARLAGWHLAGRSGGRDYRLRRRYVELFRSVGLAGAARPVEQAAGDETARPAPRWRLRLPSLVSSGRLALNFRRKGR